MQPFKHILVPTDFEAPSTYAVDLAVALAGCLDAELTLLHVWDVPRYLYSGLVLNSPEVVSSVERAAEEHLEEALRILHRKLPRAKSTLQMGVPWQVIIDTAASKCADLIIMGTHGHHGVKHAVLGSVAEKVVRLSSIPVLTAHQPAQAL